MAAPTLSPTEEAFVALSEHCALCPGCKVDLDRPQDTRECHTAQALYEKWRTLRAEEKRR